MPGEVRYITLASNINWLWVWEAARDEGPYQPTLCKLSIKSWQDRSSEKRSCPTCSHQIPENISFFQHLINCDNQFQAYSTSKFQSLLHCLLLLAQSSSTKYGLLERFLIISPVKRTNSSLGFDLVRCFNNAMNSNKVQNPQRINELYIRNPPPVNESI